MPSDRNAASAARRRWLTLLLLPAGLLALRQLIVVLGVLLPVVDEQQAFTHARGIHPADLFYTQVPLALAAEKEVRRQVEAARGR